MDLAALLHQTFGFPAFRANQEAVCRAATDGKDVLLVMPTGAGKSLCYQLPAIARGGTALVVSPLIALMDDQAAKLTAAGLRVARIHSGLDREQSRQACRDYLDGTLQFLFIAPERMRVPGFPEMLARKKPALIAIDEAHCISAWGHDFRPDYRTLGDYLPSLRPAPIIALTATATPTVQRDIVAQLQLSSPSLFIHGFRRDNLHIEVVEMSKPRRSEFAVKLLSKPENRPAIVYAPSRKAAEDLASQLGGRAAAYHAGLDPSVRERVQRHFQSGKLDVVVATIAFGMGIDKADVRTVLHIALPASVEAYYQEIGRAGRDGNPSRTVLLHSYADRKMHDFFLERDYPAVADLTRVASVLTEEFTPPEPLAASIRMSLDIFSKAVEKLTAQGAAQIDLNGQVRIARRGHALEDTGKWRASYDQQIAFRRAQIDAMAAFAESAQCRMSALIRHFGDTADGNRPCGHCDVCAPNSATAQTFRQPGTEDLRQLQAILRALDGQPRSTGKLYTELSTTALRGTPAATDRRTLDSLLDTLVRAALITVTSDTFTNAEGNAITYKKAALTHEGREAVRTGQLHAPDLLLKDAAEATSTRSSKRSSSTPKRAANKEASAAYTPDQKTLETRLRDWRKAEAARTGKPAFIVCSDSLIHNLVAAAPRTISQLLEVSGIGPDKADRYGAEIIAILTGSEAPAKPSAARPTSPATKLRPTQPRQITLPQTPIEAFSQPVRAASGLTPQQARAKAEVTVQRTRPTTPDPTDDLTPDQQQLDQRLRDWRKSESERLGLPQFFVLGTSTLRSIVLERPRTLTDLQKINGIGLEKAEKYGAGILEVCRT